APVPTSSPAPAPASHPTAQVAAGILKPPAPAASAPASRPAALQPPDSVLHVAAPARPPQPLDDQQIGRAIQHGVDWLIERFDPKTHQLPPSRYAHNSM